MTTRLQLRTDLRTWGKANEATDAQLDQFVDAGLMTCESLRSAEQMVGPTTLTLTDGTVELPDDFLAMREVASNVGRDKRVLLPAGRRAVAAWSNTSAGRFGTSTAAGDDTRVYGIVGRTLEVPQGGESDVDVIWWQKVTLPDDNATHPALQRYYQLFLNAALQHLHLFYQDYEAAAALNTVVQNQINEINAIGMTQQHGAFSGVM